MSWVTNVILTWGVGEEDARLGEVVAALTTYGRPSLVSVEDPRVGSHWCGGTKALECGIALGALNHVPVAALVAAVQGAHWEDPELVQLLIKDETDDRFHEVPLTGEEQP